MLGVGMPGITDTEGRSQFSLWCILAAPLFLGTDVIHMSATTFATISNREAIAINQDPLGIQGFALNATEWAPTPYQGGDLLNFTACPTPAPTAFSLLPDGHVQVLGSDDCVTIFTCATDAGSVVGTYGCTNNTCNNQLWSWTGPATGGALVAREAGAVNMCLAAADAGASLVIAPCDGGALQTWALGADGTLSLPLVTPAPLCLWLPTPPTINFYVKPLAPRNGTQPIAVAILNRGDAAVGPQTLQLGDLGLAPAQRVIVRDVWAATTSAPVAGVVATRGIDSHETLLLVVTPVV